MQPLVHLSMLVINFTLFFKFSAQSSFHSVYYALCFLHHMQNLDHMYSQILKAAVDAMQGYSDVWCDFRQKVGLGGVSSVSSTKVENVGPGHMVVDARSSGLKEISEDLLANKGVTHLNLSGNPITNISERLTALNLLSLKINRTKIHKLPPEVFRSLKLTEFEAAGCGLKFVPSTLFENMSIISLNLDDNCLTELPDSICSCKHLETLSLKRNSIVELPKNIGECTSLQILNVSKNPGLTLPTSLADANIKVLNCSGCSFKKWPQITCQLQSLEKLDFAENDLQNVPQSIENFTNLEDLNLSGNKIEQIPIQMSKCQKLQSLDLSNNKGIHFLDDDACTQKGKPSPYYEHLNTLICQNCDMTEFPAALCKMKNLTTIFINGNSIKDLPSGVSYLQNLQTLDLDDNDLWKLPKELVSCKKLTDFRVRGNARLTIPADILKGDLDDLKKYLKEIDESGSVPNTEVQVNLLGETGSGKSSLANLLINGKPKLTSNADRTRVVERRKWKAYDKNHPDAMHVLINDTGGHESYKAVVEILIARESISIHVFNCRTLLDSHYSKMTYIIDEIDAAHSRNPGIAVQVVGTHTDECDDDGLKDVSDKVLNALHLHEKSKVKQLEDQKQQVDDALKNAKEGDITNGSSQDELRQRLKQLDLLMKQRPKLPTALHLVSSKTGEGHEQLKSAILKLVWDRSVIPLTLIPTTWRNFRQQVNSFTSEHKQPWMTLEQAAKLAKSCSLDIDTMTPALKFLRLTGDIVWHDNNPLLKNIVFHQPLKLIDIFKPIFAHDLANLKHGTPNIMGFTSHEIEGMTKDIQERGTLSVNLIHNLWEKASIPRDQHDILLEVLKYFDLCYEITGEDDFADKYCGKKILIPWFLSSMKTLPECEIAKESIHFTLQVLFPSGVPRNLLEKFSVRVRQHVKMLKHGKGTLYAKDDDSQLFVKIVERSHGEEALQFHIKQNDRNEDEKENPFSKGLLLSCDMELESLLLQWPGVLYEKTIVCPECRVMGNTNPGSFPAEYLRKPVKFSHLDCSVCSRAIHKSRLYPSLEA